MQEALQNRTVLKQQIDNYEEQLRRYPKQLTQKYYSKRASVAELNSSSTPTAKTVVTNSENPSRYSIQEAPTYMRPEFASVLSIPAKADSPVPLRESTPSNEEPIRTSFIHVKEFWVWTLAGGD